MAAWTAAVSSVLPSAFAPKSRFASKTLPCAGTTPLRKRVSLDASAPPRSPSGTS
ncbi:MAG: hypothetical protein ACYTKD_24900 [Planctomycetota bacterium]|jgi:hypothetical protein